MLVILRHDTVSSHCEIFHQARQLLLDYSEPCETAVPEFLASDYHD